MLIIFVYKDGRRELVKHSEISFYIRHTINYYSNFNSEILESVHLKIKLILGIPFKAYVIFKRGRNKHDVKMNKKSCNINIKIM